MESDKAAFEYVAGLAVGGDRIQVITTEAEHFAVIPAGREIVSLAPYQYAVKPVRRAGTVTVRDADSFVAYWLAYHDADSFLLGDPDHFKVVGVLNYHGKGADGVGRAGDHRIVLQMAFTQRWKIWRDADNKQKSQDEFASFIEENVDDIVVPEGSEGKFPAAARMVEVARTLEATCNWTFRRAIDPRSGQVQLTYAEQIQGSAGTPVNGAAQEFPIPEWFAIRVSVFLGQPPVVIRCRLRYRVNSGKPVLWYSMHGVEQMLAGEFDRARGVIEAAAAAPVLIGTMA